MTKALNVRNPEGYVPTRCKDLLRASDLAASLASVSEQMHPAPTAPVKYEVGDISWGLTNW